MGPNDSLNESLIDFFDAPLFAGFFMFSMESLGAKKTKNKKSKILTFKKWFATIKS